MKQALEKKYLLKLCNNFVRVYINTKCYRNGRPEAPTKSCHWCHNTQQRYCSRNYQTSSKRSQTVQPLALHVIIVVNYCK